MKRSLLALVLFNLAYLLTALFFALTTHNEEFVVYIVVVFVFAMIALYVHSRVRFSTGVLWVLSIWGLLHMIGGLVHVPMSWPIDGEKHVFYSLWIIPYYLKFDQIVHAFGFGSATWACWQALKVAVNVSKPTPGLLVLCALAGMGLGAANEVIEFFTTLVVPNTNVGGYVNTGWDLVFNAVGSTVAVLIIRYGPR